MEGGSPTRGRADSSRAPSQAHQPLSRPTSRLFLCGAVLVRLAAGAVKLALVDREQIGASPLFAVGRYDVRDVAFLA